jgi:hypothetical protein
MVHVMRTLVVLSCALITTTLAAISQEYLEQWQRLPLDVKESLKTEEDINAVGPYISPVLQGGLGNMMFELASAHSIAKQAGVPCVVAWWDQSVAFDELLPYHGRKDPGPGITLKHIFPNLLYVDFKPAYRNVKSRSYEYYRWKFVPPPNEVLSLQKPYLDGYFFHPQCLLMIRDHSHSDSFPS